MTYKFGPQTNAKAIHATKLRQGRDDIKEERKKSPSIDPPEDDPEVTISTSDRQKKTGSAKLC